MKRILLSILLAMVLLIFALSVTGCYGLGGIVGGAGLAVHNAVAPIIDCHGLGETAAEQSDDHARQLRLNGSMYIDDEEAWYQMDRPSRLTEYTVR
jgi:hypothetical protein